MIPSPSGNLAAPFLGLNSVSIVHPFGPSLVKTLFFLTPSSWLGQSFKPSKFSSKTTFWPMTETGIDKQLIIKTTSVDIVAQYFIAIFLYSINCDWFILPIIQSTILNLAGNMTNVNSLLFKHLKLLTMQIPINTTIILRNNINIKKMWLEKNVPISNIHQNFTFCVLRKC